MSSRNTTGYLLDKGVSGVRRSQQSAVDSWQLAILLDQRVSMLSRNTTGYHLDKGVSGVRRSRTPEKTPFPAYGPLQVGSYAGKLYLCIPC